MPLHPRKSGPKATELERAQCTGQYPDEIAAFLRAADEYRIGRGGGPLMASDYYAVLTHKLGYRLPGQRKIRTNRWSVRIHTTVETQARFQDVARMFGMGDGRRQSGPLLGRLIAWFVQQPPHKQSEVLGMTLDPSVAPLGPRTERP